MIEYAIFGKVPGCKWERCLLECGSVSRADAERARDILATKYGCTECRIVSVNLSDPFGAADFAKAVRV